MEFLAPSQRESQGPPIVVPLTYHSQSRIPKDMGIVWVTHTITRSPLLGRQWNPSWWFQIFFNVHPPKMGKIEFQFDYCAYFFRWVGVVQKTTNQNHHPTIVRKFKSTWKIFILAINLQQQSLGSADLRSVALRFSIFHRENAGTLWVPRSPLKGEYTQ